MRIMKNIIKATAEVSVATKKAAASVNEGVKGVPGHTGNLKVNLGEKFTEIKKEYSQAVEECNAPKPLKAPKANATPVNINKEEK